jgi:hypothetical protein
MLGALNREWMGDEASGVVPGDRFRPAVEIPGPLSMERRELCLTD